VTPSWFNSFSSRQSEAPSIFTAQQTGDTWLSFCVTWAGGSFRKFDAEMPRTQCNHP